MIRTLLVFFLLLSIHPISTAQTWHVSGTGNDANDGKTPQTAFRTLQKAADRVQPGDVVLVGNGPYTNDDRTNGRATEPVRRSDGPVLNIDRSGMPGAWITWKARPGHRPDIRPLGWAGIQISGSYHVLDGLAVTGGNDSIVLLQAQEDAKKPRPDHRFNTNGIFINGPDRQPDEKPHHVTIRNCVVSQCPGGGITAIEADYFTIEDCKVSDNGWFMRYAGSGITALHDWAFDEAPGYHVVIQRNYVWNNKTLVPWERTGKLSDGNGILLDVTDQEQAQGATNPNADATVAPAGTPPVSATAAAAPEKPKRPEWKGRALIANNLSAFNGGSGIHTFRTSHVDIINNTTYHNGGIVGYQELFPNPSEDIVILNNIIVPRPGGQVTSNNRNTAIRWDYNLYPSGQEVFKGANDLVAHPLFIDVQADPTKGNFRLAKGSRALHSGTVDAIPATDITGKARTKRAGIDRGAFEQ